MVGVHATATPTSNQQPPLFTSRQLPVASYQHPLAKARRESAAHLDEADRALAGADLVDGEDAELKRLRRYESALHRQLRWSLAQLRLPPPNPSPGRDVRPLWLEARALLGIAEPGAKAAPR